MRHLRGLLRLAVALVLLSTLALLAGCGGGGGGGGDAAAAENQSLWDVMVWDQDTWE